jgi:4-amino-4-deoxy-L-arabinose transferase-like glycosyltransferase
MIWVEKMTSRHREGHDRVLLILIAFFLLTAIILSLFRYFDHDELEHVHSAWYILQGKIPYLDFYQNHNPVLWFLIAPLILFFGKGTVILFISRALMLLLLMGIALSVRSISREAGSSKREANYSALLVLSCTTVLNTAMEIRPDVPQVFFGLLSCLYFLRYLKNRQPLQMTCAGFFAGVSFVVLQKSVFFLMAVGIAMLWLLWRKAVTWKMPFLYVLGCIFPIAVLSLYLIFTGCFGDYILTCWILNMNQLKPYSPLNRMFHSLIQNVAFWGLAVFSLWTYLFRKRGGLALQMVSLWGVLILACQFFVPHLQYQYFIFPLALLAVPAARQTGWFFDRFKCSDVFRSCVLVSALIAPWCVTVVKLAHPNGPQLNMIRYVLSQTTPDEPVYDGDIQFNLFRPDLHYFWFNIKPQKGLDSYNRISGNRFSSYDIHKLIEAKKPVFISDESVNLDDPRIRGIYTSTPFPHLYRLKERSSLKKGFYFHAPLKMDSFFLSAKLP